MLEAVGRLREAVRKRVDPTPGESHMIDGPLVQALAEHGYGHVPLYQFRRHALYEGMDQITVGVEREILRLINARLARNKGAVPVELQDDTECVARVLAAFAVTGHITGKDNHGVNMSIISYAVPQMFTDDRNQEDPIERIMDMSERMYKAGLIRYEPYRRGLRAYLTPKVDVLLQ